VFARPEIFKLIESQADQFASSFLLPAESFATDFPAVSLELFRALKPKWKVSIAMMLMRARQLGSVSEEQYRKLWVSYSRRGWRKHEPLDNDLPPENPRVLRRAIELLVDSGVQTRADILTRLPFSASDIEELAGLAHGYLTPGSPSVRLLTFRHPTSVSPEVDETVRPTQVYAFPQRRRVNHE
jgi:hypothetical protein